MPLTFYDLCGRDSARFSPFGWRTRFALAHKGLDYDLELVKFTEKDKVAFSGQKLVPVIVDGGALGNTITVADSWKIAEYLEDAYPDRPSLFGGPGGRGMARAINAFVDRTIMIHLGSLIVFDVFRDHVDPGCQPYFRESREARFNKPLEEVQTGREERVETFRKALEPVRMVVADQPFIGGDSPNYGDIPLAGTLQWARLTSSFPLLAADDPVHGWFDRMLDAYDGLGRSIPAAA